MLRSLKLKNFVLFDDEEIEFSSGSTALVGQTGSGKSLILKALKVLSGERNDKTLIMKDRDAYELELDISLGEFYNINKEEIEEILQEDIRENIQIYRKLSMEGRGQIRVNGIPVTLKELQIIMSNLLSLHEQNSTNELLNEKNQTKLIDSLVDNKTIEEYQNVYSMYLKEKEKLDLLKDKVSEQDEKIELLEYQLEKINKIEQLEHEDIIEEKILKVKQKNKDSKAYEDLRTLTDEINSKIVELNDMRGELSLSEIQNKLVANLYDDIEEFNFNLTKEENTTEIEESLEDLMDNLTEIRQLKRKYNLDYEGLLAKTKDLKIQLEEYQNIDANFIEQEEEVRNLYKNLEENGKKLTKSRENVTGKIVDKINQEFKKLEMKEAEIRIDFVEEELSKNGNEQLVIYLKSNKGHDFKRLDTIASGGEKSRIILAIKKVFNEFIPVQTLVLDEIDQGVSSVVAQRIGELLNEIEEKTQLIIISHTPQVISKQKQLTQVEKVVEKDFTYSHVLNLNNDEKEKFINKMLEL